MGTGKSCQSYSETQLISKLETAGSQSYLMSEELATGHGGMARLDSTPCFVVGQPQR